MKGNFQTEVRTINTNTVNNLNNNMKYQLDAVFFCLCPINRLIENNNLVQSTNQELNF